MTPARRPQRIPTGLHLKRRKALQQARVTMAEIAFRYYQAGNREISVSAVSRVIGGQSRSEALEAFIETEILSVPRYSLFPED